MNCQKAQIHLTAHADDLVPQEVRAHLADCPHCRLAESKSRKLQSLLALKRHEQPGEFFYRTYLSEFHRRLASDLLRKKSWWCRFTESFVADRPVSWALRFSPAVAGALMLAVSLYLHLGSGTSHFQNLESNSLVAKRVQDVNASHVNFSANSLASNETIRDSRTVYVLDKVSYKPSANETTVLSF